MSTDAARPIVGISAYFHDSACCLLQNGALVAAAQEERFSRRKHDPSLPLQAFTWCLRSAGLTLADVDCLAYYENPYTKLERQLWQWWPKLTPPYAFWLWQQASLPFKAIRDVLGYDGEIDVCEHHSSHAASAFYFSGFPEAAILTVDSVGEWATTTYSRACNGDINAFEEVRFPNSLGLLYSTFTGYLGFEVNDGEYKVMGLAPYGQPRYVQAIRDLVQAGAEGQFELQAACFDFLRGDRMHSDRLTEILGCPPRCPGEPILPVHQDIARSLQIVLEECLLEKVRYLHARVPVDNLCLAGGVALNCVANSRILRDGPFKRLFVQPAAGDAGGAVGAAALAHVKRHGPRGLQRRLEHVYLGPAYAPEEVADLLDEAGIAAEDYRREEAALIAKSAELLSEGKIIGWFQGRMEFGPRALGARSILADPRQPAMQRRVNQLIKQREGFRPFAPAVLASRASEHFDLDHPSPFMLETCQVVSSLPLPAITHVDRTARVQTVDHYSEPRFKRLLEVFHDRTGCPILLNTSFNLSDEPIVRSPEDALRSFARSQLDALVLGDFIIDRASLAPGLVASCREAVPQPSSQPLARVYTF
ncbi:MAG: carbamoyltransferase family protein [Vicinamibacterales bacterium]